MPTRYTKVRRINNNSEYYEPLRQSRDKKNIVQYATTRLRNPTIDDRRAIDTTRHIWKLGDRFYKLADQFYGDAGYWWVIAWWNSYPTEATLRTGDMIFIPLDLNATLRALGI
jgi:hypothetical protein|tara:strand:- start:5048 stop:5386 length:339 start_codon:yes stop_codon:yes gene_type:complete